MSLSICIYCGARPGVDPAHADAAAELGTEIARRGWELVYGGGSVGLMGIVARAALDAGGRVAGIIPKRLLEREQGMYEVSELIVTETLRERKGLMYERSDAFVTLPGGYGTLEEVVETLTLRQLGYHNKPIYFLNTANYYAPLLGFFEHAVTAGFVHPDQLKLYELADDVGGLIDSLARIPQS